MKHIINVSILTILVLVGCKASQNFTGSESVSVKKLKKSYEDNVSFQLVNISNEPVQIESTEQYYIERNLGGVWERVPFVPCVCGTPCRPSAVEKISPDEVVEISWNMISRKCNKTLGKPLVENTEERVAHGDYRMIFNVNKERDGMRVAPEKLVVNFSIN